MAARARSVRIVQGDNLAYLATVADGSVDLVYIDPPFNTGRERRLVRVRTVRDDEGGRTGFGGRRYRTEAAEDSGAGYEDAFEDYAGFLEPRLREAHRVLSSTGSFFLHVDCRESHYCKVMLDGIFGRACFQNEIIWAYDYGARSKRRWSSKHDTIFWYSRDAKRYTFDYEAMERIPYMAPGLVSAEKAARGKTPTDVWWHTIVSPTGRERTGYPTQKPLGVLRRIVQVHSKPGDVVLDFFAGSGTTGEAAAELGRDVVLVDCSAEAVAVMTRRLARFEPEVVRLEGAEVRGG